MSDLKELKAKKESLEKKLAEIEKLCTEENENKILDAIKNQRWFFFKNKTKVLLDKKTGYLWANLDYFPYCKENKSGYYTQGEGLEKKIKNYDFSGMKNFKIPNPYELWDMINDKTFPFQSGHGWRILYNDYWLVNYEGNIRSKDLYYEGSTNHLSSSVSYLLPCSDILVKGTSYANDVSEKNKIFSDREKAKITLDLFIKNELEPVFKPAYNKSEHVELINLYKRIYIEKNK